MVGIPITKRALFARINRKLVRGHHPQKLCVCRKSSGGFDYLGRHYIVDLYKNEVVDTQVSLEALGRELGCLQPYEKLAD